MESAFFWNNSFSSCRMVLRKAAARIVLFSEYSAKPKTFMQSYATLRICNDETKSNILRN